MTFYLQMDGVDDTLLTPSVTFDEIQMDFSAVVGAWRKYIDFPGGRFERFITDFEQWNGGFSSILKNGVTQTSGTKFINDNERMTIKALTSSVFTQPVNFFSSTAPNDFLQGKIYSIKLLNAGVTVAHYDMSTQTVLDQSGNGNHATLTGGTWLDDGVGGGTAYTASLSDSVSTSEIFTKQFSATVIDSIATGEGESERTNKAFSDTVLSADSLAYTQGKAVSLSDSIAISEAISKALTKWQTDGISTGDSESEATSRRLSDAITQTDVITAFGGKSVILTEGISVSDSVAKAIGRLRSDGLGVAESLGKQMSVRLYDVVVSTDGVSTYLPNAPEYRHVMQFPVRLNTRQTFNVTITQRKQFDVDI